MLKSTTTGVAILFVLTQAYTAPASAQTVWRCGDGGKTYSDTPCPGGKALKAADQPDADAAQAARNQINRDQALADRMRQQRLDEEKRLLATNASAAQLGPSKQAVQNANKAADPRTLKRQSKLTKTRAAAAADDTFRATVPGSRRKRD